MPDVTSSRCIRSASFPSVSPARSANRPTRASSVTDAGTCRGDTCSTVPAWAFSQAGGCARAARSPLANDGSKVECASCGLVHYANPAPAVSAVVVDGAGNVLLARRAHDPDAGLWDTLGGFLDVGEEPEAGLRRELREEAGVEIEIGDLVDDVRRSLRRRRGCAAAARPVWEATIASGEPEPADDVAELRWFPRDALPRPEEIAFHALPSVLGAWAASESSPRRTKGPAEPALRLGEGEGEASKHDERCRFASYQVTPCEGSAVGDFLGCEAERALELRLRLRADRCRGRLAVLEEDHRRNRHDPVLDRTGPAPRRC